MPLSVIEHESEMINEFDPARVYLKRGYGERHERSTAWPKLINLKSHLNPSIGRRIPTNGV